VPTRHARASLVLGLQLAMPAFTPASRAPGLAEPCHRSLVLGLQLATSDARFCNVAAYMGLTVPAGASQTKKI